jgi:hypothetical protein
MLHNFVFDAMYVVGLNFFKYYNINFSNKIKLKNCTKDAKVICDVVKKMPK